MVLLVGDPNGFSCRFIGRFKWSCISADGSGDGNLGDLLLPLSLFSLIMLHCFAFVLSCILSSIFVCACLGLIPSYSMQNYGLFYFVQIDYFGSII